MRDFTDDFNKLFYKSLLMSFDVCYTGTFLTKDLEIKQQDVKFYFNL